jgi:hypothetical protein
MALSVRERTAVRRRVGLFPSIAPSLNSTLDERSPEDAALCPEIDCLRERFPDDLLAEAAQRALAIGVGAERVLIAAGAIGEEDYLRTLADALGLTFDSLDGVPRTQCPIDDQRLIEAGAAGMVPLTVGGELYLVVAPRGTAVRRIIALVEEKPELARRVRFTTSERLTAFVFRHSAAPSPQTQRMRSSRHGPPFPPLRRAGASIGCRPLSSPSLRWRRSSSRRRRPCWSRKYR